MSSERQPVLPEDEGEPPSSGLEEVMERRSWALMGDEMSGQEYARVIADFRAQQSDDDQAHDRWHTTREAVRRQEALDAYEQQQQAEAARQQAEAAAAGKRMRRGFGRAFLRFIGGGSRD